MVSASRYSLFPHPWCFPWFNALPGSIALLYTARAANLWHGEHHLPHHAMFSSAKRPKTVLQKRVASAGMYFLLTMLPSFEGRIYAVAPTSGVSLLAVHTA